MIQIKNSHTAQCNDSLGILSSERYKKIWLLFPYFGTTNKSKSPQFLILVITPQLQKEREIIITKLSLPAGSGTCPESHSIQDKQSQASVQFLASLSSQRCEDHRSTVSFSRTLTEMGSDTRLARNCPYKHFFSLYYFPIIIWYTDSISSSW